MAYLAKWLLTVVLALLFNSIDSLYQEGAHRMSFSAVIAGYFISEWVVNNRANILENLKSRLKHKDNM